LALGIYLEFVIHFLCVIGLAKLDDVSLYRLTQAEIPSLRAQKNPGQMPRVFNFSYSSEDTAKAAARS
jgi:hypothetical protein